MLLDRNESMKKNMDVLSKVFGDKQTYNFKYGLYNNNVHNMDEDPIIYGFDIIIHNINKGSNKMSSPLFNGDLLDFISFADSNNIREVSSKREVYNKFNEKFKLFFNDTKADYTSFKSHYLKSISGLNNLMKNVSGIVGTNNSFFNKWGEDKITLTMYEDTFLNSGELLMLYKNLIMSKANGKMLIPENLLRFDMSIIISEVRNFNKVKSILNGKDDATTFNEKSINDNLKFIKKVVDSPKVVINTPKPNDSNTKTLLDNIEVFKDNISRYIYNLYDCQLSFDTNTHGDEVKNDSNAFFETFSFDIYYKYTDVEFEKFNLNLTGFDTLSYINSGNIVNPFSKLDKQSTDTKPRVYDIRYRQGDKSYMVFNQKKMDDKDDVELSPLQKRMKETKNFALKRLREERNDLVNKTIANIRTNIGLRRISSPINVYTTDARSITDFIGGQIRDFANDYVSSALKSAQYKLNEVGRNIDIERVAKGKAPVNMGMYKKVDTDRDIIDGYPTT